MTANKPEVVGFATHHDEPMLLPSKGEATIHCDDGEEPVALIRLSDYEALQAECDLLRKHLQNLIDQTAPLEPVPGNPMWSRRIQLDEVIAERDQLRAECEKLRKDAERYRWLRLGAHEDSDLDRWEHVGYVCGVSVCTDYGFQQTLDAEALDAAIDAAMQGSKP